MAINNLMEAIVMSFPKMTKAERKVADYVLAHPSDVMDMSITDLSEHCGIGETSVFRFCRTMKLKGYQDFKVSLALSVNNPYPANSRAGGTARTETIQDVCQSVFDIYMGTLNEAKPALDYKKIDGVVSLMLEARGIYLFGLGISGCTALTLQKRLLGINPCVYYHLDSHAQIMCASLLGAGNLAVVFSNSGITKDCIQIARLASGSGAKVVFITKFIKTPAAQYSDIVLLSGAIEGPLQGGSIAPKISQMFIADILYSEYFRQLGEKAINNKKHTADAIAEEML